MLGKTPQGSTTFSFVVATAILIAGCSRDPVAAPAANAGFNEVDVAAQELTRTEDEALAGDLRAAAQLQATYFKTDEEQYLHWLEIGAENGDPVSQYNFAFELWAHGEASEQNQIRSKFWLGRAASAGDREAAAVLGRLNDGKEW